jgi:hypothetical protein
MKISVAGSKTYSVREFIQITAQKVDITVEVLDGYPVIPEDHDWPHEIVKVIKLLRCIPCESRSRTK